MIAWTASLFDQPTRLWQSTRPACLKVCKSWASRPELNDGVSVHNSVVHLKRLPKLRLKMFTYKLYILGHITQDGVIEIS